MKSLSHIPVSQPGQFMYEVLDKQSQTRRFITTREVEAKRMQRRGANVFSSRSGGWVSYS